MARRDVPIPDTPQRTLIDRLVADRLVQEDGSRTFALFFVTGDGEFLPGGYEVASGHLIDEHGHIFAFAFGWDRARRQPGLLEWRCSEESPHWLENGEYRRARKSVGLSFN